MSKSTYNQTIVSTRRQITNSSDLIANSKKRICKGNLLISNSETSIANSKYRFIVSVSYLANCYLVATSQELTQSLVQTTKSYHKNEREKLYLTPQESLQQIMTHPSKTGLCPYCGQTYPKIKAWVVNWNCLSCGWSDNFFAN